MFFKLSLSPLFLSALIPPVCLPINLISTTGKRCEFFNVLPHSKNKKDWFCLSFISDLSKHQRSNPLPLQHAQMCIFHFQYSNEEREKGKEREENGRKKDRALDRQNCQLAAPACHSAARKPATLRCTTGLFWNEFAKEIF